MRLSQNQKAKIMSYGPKYTETCQYKHADGLTSFELSKDDAILWRAFCRSLNRLPNKDEYMEFIEINNIQTK